MKTLIAAPSTGQTPGSDFAWVSLSGCRLNSSFSAQIGWSQIQKRHHSQKIKSKTLVFTVASGEYLNRHPTPAIMPCAFLRIEPG